MTPYVLEFELPGLPPTANKSLWQHWAVKTAETRKWKRLVGFACHGKKPPRPLEKAQVTLSRYSSACPDSDGLVSSFKCVLDSLVEAGILADDNFQVIGMPSYQWFPAKPRRGRIRVRVEELPIQTSSVSSGVPLNERGSDKGSGATRRGVRASEAYRKSDRVK